MLPSKKNRTESLPIDVKKLKKLKLKGAFSIGFIVKISGFLDNRKGLISVDGIKISSPWISKKQNCYNRYSALLYKAAGEIMKSAYIQREKVNDELKRAKEELKEEWKKYEKELKDSKEITLEELETIGKKRKVLNTKKYIKVLEERIAEKFSILKELKISIDEAEHELKQILQEKKLILESQVLTYIRGAKKMSHGTEILADNEISKSLFNAFEREFEYCLEEKLLISDEEKEDVKNDIW